MILKIHRYLYYFLLFSVLPAPTQFLQDLEEDDDDFTTAILNEKTVSHEVIVDKIPPYGNRSGWIPRFVEVLY